jgi:hypothetical protein
MQLFPKSRPSGLMSEIEHSTLCRLSATQDMSTISKTILRLSPNMLWISISTLYHFLSRPYRHHIIYRSLPYQNSSIRLYCRQSRLSYISTHQFRFMRIFFLIFSLVDLQFKYTRTRMVMKMANRYGHLMRVSRLFLISYPNNSFCKEVEL